MTLDDAIEDAFLSALEDGADPPREFTIRVSDEAWQRVRQTTRVIAGYTITVLSDDAP